MSARTVRPGATAVLTGLRARARELRAHPDRGSHATEYAIGIGLAAAVIIGLFAAYQIGIDNIIASWFFG